MPLRRNSRVAAACLLVLTTAALAPEDAQLAEQFNRAAGAFAGVPGGAAAAMALADAGQRGIGDDLRLIRQAIDLRLSLGQRDQAIDLLAQYRKLDIEDELAQVQYIDLLTGRMQSAEERANYLRRVIDAPTVSPAVRAHAAVLLRHLLIERGDDAAASAALDEALKLNPANPRALQLSLDRALADAGRDGAPKRAAAAVALLQSNPMQPATLALLAEELARAARSRNPPPPTARRSRSPNPSATPPAAHDAVNAASVYHAHGKRRRRGRRADIAAKVDSSLAQAWFMKVLLAKQADPAARVDAARDALVRNVMAVHAAGVVQQV
jgi:tetratricopeptide (TPR) repeat protein